MSNNFFTDKDTDNLIFFQVPKVLILGDKYKSMKPNALKLYIVLLDRMKLSMKNEWKNDKGFYYVRMAQELAAELFGWSPTTFRSCKKELEKYDLLIQEREGQGKSNKLFIKKCDYEEDDIFKIKSVDSDLEDEEQKAKNIDIKQKDNFCSSEENELKYNNCSSRKTTFVLQEGQQLFLKKDNNCSSRKTTSNLLEGQLLTSNNNNYINNNLNNNNNTKNELSKLGNVNNVNNETVDNNLPNKKDPLYFDNLIESLRIKYINKGLDQYFVEQVLDEAIDNIIEKDIKNDEAYLNKSLYNAYKNKMKINN